MSDLNLTSFNPLYPMRIHQYNELINDQNTNVMDKVNSIIDYLNQVGKLTNDVVKDWNTVYNWVMNEGLTTDVNNKLEAMLANHEFDPIMNTILTKIGDLTTLSTTAKDTIVNAINSLQSDMNTKIGDLTTLQTVDKSSLVHAVNENTTLLAQIASQTINVKSFGAKGDTILNSDNTVASGTDDTTAIQNALNSVPTSPNNKGGYVLYFPPGIYLISSTIVVPSLVRVTFRGTGVGGSNATIIKCANSNMDMIDASTHILDTFSMEYMQLQGAGMATGTGRGLLLGRTNTSAYDSRIFHNWFTAIPMTAVYASNMQGYHIESNGIEIGTYGIDIESGSDNVITNNRFYGLSKAGIFINGAGNNNNTINSNHFDVCGVNNGTDNDGAIVLQNNGLTEIRNTLIATNNFKGNQQDVVLLGSGTLNAHTGISNTTIVGNTSDFARKRAFNVNAGNGTRILSNTINDSNQSGSSAIPAIDIQGASDRSVIDGNVVTYLPSGNGVNQQVYGIQLGATSTNTTLGDNNLMGSSSKFNIISGATLLDLQMGTGWQSYTPTLYGDSTSGSNTYATQQGYWRQVGNEVTVYITIVLSVKDVAMAGNVRISLPITNGLKSNGIVDISEYDNVTIATNYNLTAIVPQNTNYIRMQQNSSNIGVAMLPVSGIANTTGLTLKATYLL